MVTAHNRWRAQVGVAPLRWSDALASSAQAWADRLAARGCRMEHQRGSGVGENLFKASPLRSGARGAGLAPVTAFDVVDAWGEEVRSYSARSNRCQPGRTCGHYTQIVWRATQEVGCGMAVCADLAQIWVCNYRPPGNIAGRRPY